MIAGRSEVVASANWGCLDGLPKRRRIELLRGAVLVEVPRSDREAAFIVVAGDVGAEALGTRYAVRITSGPTRVSVYESEVRVQVARKAAIDLKPGQAIDIDSGTPGRPYTISEETPDWASRRLVFNDAPLSQVVESLARYRPGLVRLSDATARADRRFTGVLPTDDSEAALTLLARSLDLEIRPLYGLPDLDRVTRHQPARKGQKRSARFSVCFVTTHESNAASG